MTQSPIEIKRHLKAQKTLYELSGHPALPNIFSILQLTHLDIVLVCKRDQTRPFKGNVEVFYTPKNYKLYKKKFDKEFKEYTKEELKREKLLTRVDVSYKKLYGESWKPDHIEYWGELCFAMFIGKKSKESYHPTGWSQCVGVSTSGRNFEDMIIKLGQKFFKYFGKFNEEDFLTTAEKKNHKKEHLFFTKPAKDGHRGSYLISNPKYIRVEDGEINHRWLKWFSKTEYGKKNWGSTIKDILAGKKVK